MSTHHPQRVNLVCAGLFGMSVLWSCSSGQPSAQSSGSLANSSGGSTSGHGTSTARGTSTGSVTSTIGSASCSNVSACGGSVVGTWNASSSCLAVSGSLDPSTAGLSCSSAPVTGSLTVTGTWTGDADGTFLDETVTSGTEQFTLAKSCLVLSSTNIDCSQVGNVATSMGFASATCTATSSGDCSCSGVVQQTGGMGLVSLSAATSGTYTTSNGVLATMGNGNAAYCTQGTTLTVTPQSASPTVTGTIELQKGSGAMSSSASANSTASTTSASGSTSSTSAGTSTSSTGGPATAPCDIFAAAGSPCVAAHSTVRSLFASYNSPLYQVRRVSDGTTKDVPVLAGTGVADASVQESFCGTTAHACTISIIYDQTGNGNDLKVANVCPTCSGCPSNAGEKGQKDVEAFADGAQITIAGHTAYGLRILPCGGGIPNQTGYRCDTTKKTATGDQPESVYFVVDGVHSNGGCCYDYGNASPTDTASGNMDAIEFSSNKYWGYGAGTGPWIAADLEAGVYAWNGGSGNWENPNSTSLAFPFVTALLKNNQNGITAAEGPFVLKGGNGQSGALSTMWSGARPNGYATLKKGGAIVLGIGGDNASGAAGNFFEGALTASFDSKATDDALQANIVAAGYGR